MKLKQKKIFSISFLLCMIVSTFIITKDELDISEGSAISEIAEEFRNEPTNISSDDKRNIKEALSAYRFLIQRYTTISNKIDLPRRLVAYPACLLISYLASRLTYKELNHCYQTVNYANQTKLIISILLGVSTFIISNYMTKISYSLAGRLTLSNILPGWSEKLHLEKSLLKQKDTIVMLASKVNRKYLIKLAKQEENSDLKSLLFGLAR